MSSDVESECSEESIAEFSNDHRYERIPHPVGVDAVFRTGELRREATIYVVITEGEVIHTSWETDDCDGCEENETYSPRMGRAVRTAQRRRRAANCQHANVASEAFLLDSEGRCSDCGGWCVGTTEHTDSMTNRVVLVEEHCAECGGPRGTGL